MTTASQPVVTAVHVGTGSAVHDVAGEHTRPHLIAVGAELDTLCGARAAGRSRDARHRLPWITLASTGYGITCKRCRRSLGLS
jgi:hypothetical protein